ncbi:hypothetical protein B0J18DRAFT_487484 [Chaetomium sp. MPI-SDFR-AT-0129]|nr:hypothetical protein B0J18DRAFT_487484 [Chaetomium sp. MPI-SDFR-AT-0129]
MLARRARPPRCATRKCHYSIEHPPRPPWLDQPPETKPSPKKFSTPRSLEPSASRPQPLQSSRPPPSRRLRPPRTQQPQTTLYEQLFPTQQLPTAPRPPRRRPHALIPPEPSNTTTTENEPLLTTGSPPTLAGTAFSAPLNPSLTTNPWTTPTTPLDPPITERAVVILTSASRSLSESDLYRWAAQGQHMAGWAGGISRTLQAISFNTRTLRGQYFVFFDTWDAARGYAARLREVYEATLTAEKEHGLGGVRKQEVEQENTARHPPPLELRAPPRVLSTSRLWTLVEEVFELENPDPRFSLRRRFHHHHNDSHSDSHSDSDAAANPVSLAAFKRMHPRRVYSRHGEPSAVPIYLVNSIFYACRVLSKKLPGLRGPPIPNNALNLPNPLHPSSPNLNPNPNPHTSDNISPTTTPPPTPTNTSIARVALRLTGSKMTLAGMNAALVADGVARNLPWRLASTRRVVPGLDHQGSVVGDGSGDDDGNGHHREGQGQGQVQGLGYDDGNGNGNGNGVVADGSLDGSGDGHRGYPAVQPLQAGSGQVGFGKDGNENGNDDEEVDEMERPIRRREVGYTQFVITLADVAEGRRFARAWHRRELGDARTGRMMTVDAAMLW